jgi:hypothetical protein
MKAFSRSRIITLAAVQAANVIMPTYFDVDQFSLGKRNADGDHRLATVAKANNEFQRREFSVR